MSRENSIFSVPKYIFSCICTLRLNIFVIFYLLVKIDISFSLKFWTNLIFDI